MIYINTPKFSVKYSLLDFVVKCEDCCLKIKSLFNTIKDENDIIYNLKQRSLIKYHFLLYTVYFTKYSLIHN